MTFVTLIVMEPGSEWPGHVGHAEHLVAVGHDGEGFLERTLEKLELLRRRGQPVRVAVLACSGAADSSLLARRAEVSRALLSTLEGVASARLVLYLGGRIMEDHRRDLLGLAGALCHELDGRSTEVSVKFGLRDRQPVSPDRTTRSTRMPSASPRFSHQPLPD